MLMDKKTKLGYVFCFSCLLGTAQLSAVEQDCDDKDSHYKSCDNQVGWYIGGGLGYGKTQIGDSDLNNFYQLSGLNSDSINLDKVGTSSSLFGGYQFNTNFALEAGVLDLGERSVSYTGTAANIGSFYDYAQFAHPQSAEGGTIALVASLPLTELLKVSAKVGYFFWEDDYISYDSGNNAQENRMSGSDLMYGLELNYRHNDRVQLYISGERYELENHDVNRYGLGLRYYFGADKPQKVAPPVVEKPIVKEEPKEKIVVEEKVVINPDLDGDGVLNEKDLCPDTKPGVKVVSNGCPALQTIRLHVQFDTNSSVIKPEFLPQINDVVKKIQKYDQIKLTVEGHTDWRGPQTSNQPLSERRAKAVADALIAATGLSEKLFTVVGYGELKPIATNETKEGQYKNRRVEVTIESQE